MNYVAHFWDSQKLDLELDPKLDPKSQRPNSQCLRGGRFMFQTAFTCLVEEICSSSGSFASYCTHGAHTSAICTNLPTYLPIFIIQLMGIIDYFEENP